MVWELGVLRMRYPFGFGLSVLWYLSICAFLDPSAASILRGEDRRVQETLTPGLIAMLAS